LRRLGHGEMTAIEAITLPHSGSGSQCESDSGMLSNRFDFSVRPLSRPSVREPQMMICQPAPTDQTGLFGYEPRVIRVTNAARLGDRHKA
jgi:hypothetical protein